jgi:hypothetical protein
MAVTAGYSGDMADAGDFVRPAVLGELRTGGRFSTSMELTVPQTVFGAARLSGTGSLSAAGYVISQPTARRWIKPAVAAAAFAGLYVAVPFQVVERAAAYVTVVWAVVSLRDRFKQP